MKRGLFWRQSGGKEPHCWSRGGVRTLGSLDLAEERSTPRWRLSWAHHHQTGENQTASCEVTKQVQQLPPNPHDTCSKCIDLICSFAAEPLRIYLRSFHLFLNRDSPLYNSYSTTYIPLEPIISSSQIFFKNSFSTQAAQCAHVLPPYFDFQGLITLVFKRSQMNP